MRTNIFYGTLRRNCLAEVQKDELEENEIDVARISLTMAAESYSTSSGSLFKEKKVLVIVAKSD